MNCGAPFSNEVFLIYKTKASTLINFCSLPHNETGQTHAVWLYCWLQFTATLRTNASWLLVSVKHTLVTSKDKKRWQLSSSLKFISLNEHNIKGKDWLQFLFAKERIKKTIDHLQAALRLSLETKYVAVLSLASWEIRSWLEFFTFFAYLLVVVVFQLFVYVLSLTLRWSTIR